jgi:hypothetical protein
VSNYRSDLQTYCIPILGNGHVNGIVSRKKNNHRAKKKASVEVSNDKHTKTVDHKVAIIGDSHFRGISLRVNFRSANTEVIGVVKPGASVENIVNSTVTDLENLTKNDVIVFNGGSYDMNKNNMNLALSQITKFIQDNNKTNVIIWCIPHRYDLPDFSCVNREIQVFNRTLVKIVKLFKHTRILEANFNRELFTCHGLYLNGAGKEIISKQIASLINKLIRSERKLQFEVDRGNRKHCKYDIR